MTGLQLRDSVPPILEKLSGERPALDRQGAGSNPASRSRA